MEILRKVFLPDKRQFFEPLLRAWQQVRHLALRSRLQNAPENFSAQAVVVLADNVIEGLGQEPGFPIIRLGHHAGHRGVAQITDDGQIPDGPVTSSEAYPTTESNYLSCDFIFHSAGQEQPVSKE